MAAGTNCFGVPPFFFRKRFSGHEGKEQANKSSRASKNHKQTKGETKGGITARSSCGVAKNFAKMNELQNKIMTFRDLLDLSPCITSASIHQLMIWTLKDLSRLYANIKQSISISELERSSTNQVLNCFCGVLKSIGDSWTNNGQWMVKCKYIASSKLDQNNLEKMALALLEDMNKLARERMFDMMDEDEQMKGSSSSENAFGNVLSESYSDSGKTSISSSPATPTSVLPDISNALSKGKNLSYAQPLLLPLRVQAVEKLNPIDLKRLSFHMFSHIVAQDPNFLNQINEREMRQKIEVPAKYESEVTVDGSDENSLTFEMEEEISVTSLDESENNNGRDWASAANAKPAKDAYSQLKLHIGDFQPPLSLRRLRSKAYEDATLPPPEQSALLFPNAVSSPIATPSAPPPPPPPPPTSIFLPNKVLPEQQPLAPSLEPTSQSPDIPRNPERGPPAPPPPPPIAAGIKATLPPSPPPPPLTSSTTKVFPPPPPPPMTSSSTMVIPDPPSPLPTPMASGIKTGPPPPLPPASVLRNSASHPPPPPPPMATANMEPKPPLPPMGTSNEGAPTPPLPLPPMGTSNGGAPTPPLPPMGISNGRAPPPPLPPMGTYNGGAPALPPPMATKAGGGPPPPPGLGGALRARKAVSKLKRSSQMGQLYRLLKGKVEGSSVEGRKQRQGKIGATASGGKHGMADALAEMTKRSTYFIQIEEDVKNHAQAIRELKVSIAAFKCTDMAELQKFHKHVESHLEKLTDESQVLARFEDFPTKKLEALRMAAALYSKLDNIATTLKNWQMEHPVNPLLDKIENYFNKIKVELDALERTKEEESKKFKSHNIGFDFGILIRIKELMVDVSSGCMELALEEGRKAKAKENAHKGTKSEGKKKGHVKILWRAFQFAYRVYTFAGGHDDRADRLTREVAREIESNHSD